MFCEFRSFWQISRLCAVLQRFVEFENVVGCLLKSLERERLPGLANFLVLFEESGSEVNELDNSSCDTQCAKWIHLSRSRMARAVENRTDLVGGLDGAACSVEGGFCGLDFISGPGKGKCRTFLVITWRII